MMNDRISREVSGIKPSHPIFDFLTLREIFQLTPISKAVMAATEYLRFGLVNRRLVSYALAREAEAIALEAEAKEETPVKQATPALPHFARFHILASQLDHSWLDHIKPYTRFQQNAVPAHAHLLLKPAYLRNLFSPNFRIESNRLRQLLGKRLLLALHADNEEDAPAVALIESGADLNLKRNPAVTTALKNHRFNIVEQLLADADVNITRFNTIATDTETLIAAYRSALQHLVEFEADEIAEATVYSDRLLTTLIALFQRGLSKTVLYQLLIVQHNGTSFVHWIARYNTNALRTLLNSLSTLIVDADDVQSLFALFSLPDTSRWTIGHTIAYYQNSALTQKYLALLNTMLEKKLSPHTLAALIAMTTARNTNIGHVIAKHRNPKTNKLFLQFFMTLLDQTQEHADEVKKDNISIAKAIIQLFKESNQDEDSIGHILATGDTETLLFFLDILKRLVQTHPDKVLEILYLSDRDHSSFGLGISAHQPAHVMQCYLEIIESLLLNEHLPESIYELILKQADDKWNLGHTIANFSTHENRLRYVKILIELYKNGISADNILFLLQLKSDNEKTLAHYIAINNDSEAAEWLIQLLTKLLNEGAEFRKLFALLNTFDRTEQDEQVDKKTVAHYFFEQLNANAGLALLKFLHRLTKENPHSETENSLLDLLKATTHFDRQNCGIIIAIWQKPLLPYYLTLLNQLASNPANRKAIYDFLMQKDRHGFGFGTYLARYGQISLARQYFMLIATLNDELSPDQTHALAKQVIAPGEDNLDHAALLNNPREVVQLVNRAELLSDDEFRNELLSRRFYISYDLTIASKEILGEFHLDPSKTKAVAYALLTIFHITPLPESYSLTHDNQSPFGNPYVVRFTLKYGNKHVDHFRAPITAKVFYNPTTFKSLYFDIHYFINGVYVKEGVLAQHMHHLAATRPLLLETFQAESAQVVLPQWKDIRRNLYPIFGEHGSTLTRNSDLLFYVLMHAFHVEETPESAHYFAPTVDSPLFNESTIIFRLGITIEAAMQLATKINAQFGNASVYVENIEGVYFNNLLMFDLVLSKKLLTSPQFIELMTISYQELLWSSDLQVQNYIDRQFIKASLLPKSCQELALQLADFDAHHIPKTTNVPAMKMLVGLIVELKEALEAPLHDTNKLQKLTSRIQAETQSSVLIAKFGIINAARERFKPVEEIVDMLQQRFGPAP